MHTSPVSASIEHVLLTVIVQLAVIILAARIFGAIFRKLGQPQVCGEIAAGLVLGPSLFGGVFPDLFRMVFDPSAGQVMAIMSQLGLVLLMFMIGLEFDFSHLNDNRRTALSVSVSGIVVPFGMGFWLGWFMHGQLGLAGPWLHLALFMGAAVSITSIPVLGRIMMELNINRTRIGSITITAAAIDDAAGWMILALATAIVRANLDPVKMSLMLAQVTAFVVFMALVVRPAVIKWSRKSLAASGGDLTLDSLAVLLVLVLLSAIATNLIGIFSIFGAFLFGSILYDQTELVAAIRRRLNDFITVFFLPIFFTYTGLRTDIGSMSGAALWAFCVLVFFVATAGKFGGCSIAARLNGVPWRESAIIGILMNARALMGLIVINIGYDLGILPKSVFVMLVFMAVFTTYMTAPALRRMIPKSEIERAYLDSKFAQSSG